MGAWSCKLGEAMPTKGSKGGAPEDHLVKKSMVDMEGETGLVEVATDIFYIEMTTEAVEVVDKVATGKLVEDTELEITTMVAEVKDMDEEAAKETVDIEQTPYQINFRSSPECNSVKKKLMKKECKIAGQRKTCQTFDVEVGTIVEEEICHSVTTRVYPTPSTRSGEEVEATTTVPKATDTESMETTSVAIPVPVAGFKIIGKKESGVDVVIESTDTVVARALPDGKSLKQEEPHACVDKTSEVCFPSQRVEKVMKAKELCWVSRTKRLRFTVFTFYFPFTGRGDCEL